MRLRLIALIVLIAALLSGCGYWVVEEPPGADWQFRGADWHCA